MISDWKGDRRIGPASPLERLRSELPAVLLLVGFSAAFSLCVVVVKWAVGDLQTLRYGVLLGSLCFMGMGAYFMFVALSRRRWIVAISTAVLVAAIGLSAIRFGERLVLDTRCSLTPCIIPDSR